MLSQLVLNDIDRGVIKRKHVYLLTALLLVMVCIAVSMKLNAQGTKERINGSVSIADIYMAFFRGSPVINPDDGKNFYLSEAYLLLTVGAAYIVGSYAVRDLYGVGMQIIIRCRSVRQWWFSKIIWCAISSAFIHLTIFLSMLMISIINHYELTLSVNSSVLLNLGYGNSELPVTAPEIFIMCFLLPYLSTFSLTLLQMLLSLILSPVIAFVLIMAEAAACIYSSSGLFLSNGLMFIRNNMFCNSGTDIREMLICTIMAVIISSAAGLVYMSKTDLITEQE